MLDILRRGASTWVSKVLLGLLMVSFGYWGIADVFKGAGSTTVAAVGGTKITIPEFNAVYQRQLDSIARRRGKPMTREEALAVGLPSQVLSSLVTDATISVSAGHMGLGLSDAELVRQIAADPNFRAPSGQFERSYFAQVLRNNNWTEDQYIKIRRESGIRQQLIEGMVGGVTVPNVLLEAVNRNRTEERTVDYIVLQPAVLGPIADPSDAELAKFFDERKAAFKAPELRKLVVVSIDAATIAKPEAVTEADAKAAYDRDKARYSEPERRRVEQLPFDNQAAAEAAVAKLTAGASFDDLLAEQKLTKADVDLGLMPKANLLDPAVADAAFQLAKPGDVSGVVAGRYRTVVLRVTEIAPAGVKPIEAVLPTIKAEIAKARAESELVSLHDQIEDARAGTAKLEEIAKKFNLTPIIVDAVSRDGNGADGKPVANLVQPDKLIKAAFESDVGVENDPLAIGAKGFVWYEVAGITPARDRTLDEVKTDVAARWRDEQVNSRLGAKSTELVDRLRKGESLAEVAKSVDLEVKTSAKFHRGDKVEGLSPAAVTVAFGGPEGYAATAAGDEAARIVMVVKDVVDPPFFAEADDNKAPARELAQDLQNTLLDQYLRQTQSDLGVNVYNDVLSIAISR